MIGLNPEYNTNNVTGLPDGIYRLYKRLPESKLEEYAIACIEAVLNHCTDACEVYKKIVQSWEKPGCQILISGYAGCKHDTRKWLRERTRASVKNKALPNQPGSWKDVILEAENNVDFQELMKYVNYFILVGFNRVVDLNNRTPKIIPRESSNLARMIVSCSLFDYLQTKQELKGTRILPDDELMEFRLFCQTLTSDPTTRIGRQMKRAIIQSLRKRGFSLHHSQMISYGAEMWYRARVLYTTAREAADYYHIDPFDLSKRIEAYDDATGWPRHR